MRHRQVHPSFVQDGKASSQAYTPTLKDEGRLSVYDGATFTAKQSFDHYTDVLHLSAHGTLSLSIAEIEAAGLTHAVNNDPFVGHAYIDFRGLTSSAVRAKASMLKRYGNDRGWTYAPA